MFTGHPSKSATSDRTEYYMTQIKTWGMTGSIETFREGATWYRNGRDWAKEQRDEAIRRANEKATQKIVESTAANVSFSTVCEISSTESVVSITEQSYFSLNAQIQPRHIQCSRHAHFRPNQLKGSRISHRLNYASVLLSFCRHPCT